MSKKRINTVNEIFILLGTLIDTLKESEKGKELSDLNILFGAFQLVEQILFAQGSKEERDILMTGVLEELDGYLELNLDLEVTTQELDKLKAGVQHLTELTTDDLTKLRSEIPRSEKEKVKKKNDIRQKLINKYI